MKVKLEKINKKTYGKDKLKENINERWEENRI